MNWAIQQESLVNMARALPNHRFYGEWLVPHSLKTYRDDAWRKFYLFDVLGANGEFVHYDDYSVLCKRWGVEFIPCTLKATNPTYEMLHEHALKNTFLLQEGQGYGEGIVIKQYGWKNRYGNPAYAKLITSAFKEAHIKEMGGQVLTVDLVEEDRPGIRDRPPGGKGDRQDTHRGRCLLGQAHPSAPAYRLP